MKSENSISFFKYCLSFIKSKWLLRLALVAVGLIVLLWLAAFALFQWYLVPRLPQYQAQLVQRFHEQTGHTLTIGSLNANWQIIVPRLTAENINVNSPIHVSPLHLSKIELIPSWTSLLTLSPRFSEINITAPQLDIVRTKDNKWLLNGWSFAKSQGKPEDRFSFVNMVLSQRNIQINQAQISYEDQLVGLSKLEVKKGDLVYNHGWFKNSLEIDGSLLQATQKFNLHASWRGSDASKWQMWSGSITSQIGSTQTQNFAGYFGSLFKKAEGEGDATMALSFSEGEVSKLTADFNLLNINLQDDAQNTLNVPKLGGQLEIVRKGKQYYQVNANKLHFSTDAGVGLDEGQLTGEVKFGEDGFGSVTVNQFELVALDPIVRLVGAKQNSVLANIAPMGVMNESKASWTGSIIKPKTYSVEAKFTDVGWSDADLIPGLNHATGNIRFDEKSGAINVRSQKSTMNYPRIFLKPIKFNDLNAEINWLRTDKDVQWTLNKITFENDDLKGRVNGTYKHIPKGKAGTRFVDLTGELDALNAQSVPNYLPVSVKDHAREWLSTAFLAGHASKGTFKLTGNPLQFPFTSGVGGEFLVRAQVNGVKLRFLPEWPELENIAGSLEFKNDGMTILASSGSSEKIQLKNTKVTVPNFRDPDNLWLNVTGDLTGDLSQLVAYTRKTPIVKWTGNLVNEVQGSGHAGMRLDMQIPLRHARNTKVAAKLQLNQNQVTFTKLPVPRLQNVTGDITFTQNGLEAKNVSANVFGGTVRMQTTSTANHVMNFRLDGTINTEDALRFYVPGNLNLLTGRSTYQVGFTIDRGLRNLWVKSDLRGSRSSLPVPESDYKPLSLQLTPSNSAWRLDAGLGLRNSASVRFANGRFLNATVGVGTASPPMPPRGVRINAVLPELNLDQALSTSGSSSGKALGNFYPVEFRVSTPTLISHKLSFHNLNASGVLPRAESFVAQIKSDELAGNVKYGVSARDLLVADLDYFKVDLAALKNKSATTDISKQTCFNLQSLPHVEATINHLWLNDRDFGKLGFKGNSNREGYRVEDFALTGTYATLSGNLALLSQPSACARMDGTFNLKSDNFGAWLKAMDLSEQLEDGKANIKIQLVMDNVRDITLDQLDGKINWTIKDGRLVNVSTGIGKLLGLFDVRMLTRRFIFTFGDVFLPGLTFNATTGSAEIDKGIITTKNLTVSAPGVDAKLAGSVDLIERTLDLKLVAGPNLGVLHAGVAMVNTIVGVDEEDEPPALDESSTRMFEQRYRITGPWSDPKIKRTESTPVKPS